MGAAEKERVDGATRYVRELRRALVAGDPSVTLEAMATAALGPQPIRPARIRAEVEVGVLHGQEIIFTSEELSEHRARWCAAHTFAGWLLRRDGHPHAAQKKLRATLAAELLFPADLARQLLPMTTPEAIAAMLRLPLSFVLLREAEIFRRPTALVVPGRWARVLGDDNGRLPVELDALELLASKRGIGVERWEVPEDRGVVIRVAA